MAQPVKILLAKPRNLSSFLGLHRVERTNYHKCPLIFMHVHMCTHEITRTFNNDSDHKGKNYCQGGLRTSVTNVLWSLAGNMEMVGSFIYK